MSKKRIKQYLMLLTVVGLVAIAAGGGNGTFASFSAQVTNPGNTFASGTLFLHENGKDSNGSAITQCNSESGALNVNSTCDVLFNNVDLSNGATTADLALTNDGSLTANHIKFDVSGCTWSDNFANTNSHVTFVSPTDCSGLYITIQEVADNTYSVPTGDVYCAYGPTTNGTDCNAPDNTATLDDVTGMTQLDTVGPAAATLDPGEPTPGTTPTRYYVITIDPTGVGTGNALQNLSVSFDMNWELTQL